MEVILGLLGFAGVCLLIVKLIESFEKEVLGQNEQELEDYNKAVHETELKNKYNNYMRTCPMCGSKKVSRLTDLNRAASIAVKGLASDKIGKQYECGNCRHKW